MSEHYIQTLKLVTGEEIIADLVVVGDTHIVVSDPRLFAVMQDPQTHKIVFDLIPYLMSVKDQSRIHFSLNNVVCHTKCAEEVEEAYKKAVGISVIQVATPGGLIKP